MKILIAVPVAQRHHTPHPKMVGERADQADGLFEAVLDFEAQAIETNDVYGIQRKIRAHQQESPPVGVYDGHEADELSGRTPQQVANTKAKNDLVLAVNGTGSLLHRSGIGKQRVELDLFAIALGCSPLALAFRRFGGFVGNRVGSNTAEQVMTLLKQGFDDLARGVVGIGDKVERGLDVHGPEQAKHFVEQGTLVAIEPNQTFMDPRSKRYGEHARGRVNEQTDGLQGVPHDVLGLGVGFRLLMQQLDCGHLLAPLRDLDAVPDQNKPTIDTHGAWEQLQHRLCPQSGEPVELDRPAVKEPEQGVVEFGPQVERSHDAGDAQLIHAHDHASHDRGEPHEGNRIRECRTERLNGIPYRAPER